MLTPARKSALLVSKNREQINHVIFFSISNHLHEREEFFQSLNINFKFGFSVMLSW